MHHVLDDYQYEVFHGLTIPLPIIIYTEREWSYVFFFFEFI